MPDGEHLAFCLVNAETGQVGRGHRLEGVDVWREGSAGFGFLHNLDVFRSGDDDQPAYLMPQTVVGVVADPRCDGFGAEVGSSVKWTVHGQVVHHDVQGLALAVHRHVDEVRVAFVLESVSDDASESEKIVRAFRIEQFARAGNPVERLCEQEFGLFVSGPDESLVFVEIALNAYPVVKSRVKKVCGRAARVVLFKEVMAARAVANRKDPFPCPVSTVIFKQVSLDVKRAAELGAILASFAELFKRGNDRSGLLRVRAGETKKDG